MPDTVSGETLTPEPDQLPMLERLYEVLPLLPRGDLKRMLVHMGALRQKVSTETGIDSLRAHALLDLLIGDVYARVGSLDHAFANWRSALQGGLPILDAVVAGHNVAHLVNRRCIEHVDYSGPHRKPRVLLLGAFPLACMVSAETVHITADATASSPRWDADLSQIAYDWRRCTMDDIMALLPPGWQPEFLIAANFDGIPLPSGLESLSIPKIGWAGDFINLFDAVAECASLFDLLVVDQERDVEFAVAHGFSNVVPLLMQSLQTLALSTHGMTPYRERTVDVAFLGLLDTFPIYASRREALAKLQALSDRYEIRILDNIVDFDSMYELLGNSKIGVNVNAEFIGRWAAHSYSDACPRRIYEITSMGALCLTPESTAGIHEQYDVGREVVCFTPESFEAQLVHYLEHPEIAEEVAASGQQRTIAQHTIVHRFTRLLDIARNARADRRTPIASDAISKQQYYLTGSTSLDPNIDLSSTSGHNIAACVDASLDAPARSREYAVASAQDAKNITYRLNAMCHAVETGDWDAALSAASVVRELVREPIESRALTGWMRRQLYMGRISTAPWWRLDLRFELANALYVDPSRGDEFAGYMRSHIEVVVLDYQGCFSYILGRPEDAVAFWGEGSQLDFHDEYIPCRLAEYWASLSDYDTAEPWCRAVAKIRPFNVHNAVTTARIHELHGRTADADAIYQSLGYRLIHSRADARQWVAENPGLLPR